MIPTDLQAKPLELDGDEFVTRHHRLHIVLPIGSDQRTSARFLTLELCGVLVGLEVTSCHRVIGNVDVHDLTLFQLVRSKFMYLSSYTVQ